VPDPNHKITKSRFDSNIIQPRRYIDLLKFERPEGEFMVLESVTQQSIKIVHVIDMDAKSMIRVGRGHDCQVRITDISVSRLHAFFRKSTRGDFLLEDNGSKFGTLV
jgi:FHA domain